MKSGKYKVQITGCFTGESSEKKTPFYGLEFANEAGDCIDHVAWMTEKTAERNVELLCKLGYTGKSLADMSDVKKKVSELFPAIQDPIFITVEDEEYNNAEGLTRVKQAVKWVNVGASGPARFDHKQAVAVFKGLTFDGDLLRMRNQVAKPLPAAAGTAQPGAASSDYSAENVPF